MLAMPQSEPVADPKVSLSRRSRVADEVEIILHE